MMFKSLIIATFAAACVHLSLQELTNEICYVPKRKYCKGSILHECTKQRRLMKTKCPYGCEVDACLSESSSVSFLAKSSTSALKKSLSKSQTQQTTAPMTRSAVIQVTRTATAVYTPTIAIDSVGMDGDLVKELVEKITMQ